MVDSAAKHANCACDACWMQEVSERICGPRHQRCRSAPLEAGGEAVNELTARRSTAAQSANHKHSSLLPDRPDLPVCGAIWPHFPLHRCRSRPLATHG